MGAGLPIIEPFVFSERPADSPSLVFFLLFNYSQLSIFPIPHNRVKHNPVAERFLGGVEGAMLFPVRTWSPFHLSHKSGDCRISIQDVRSSFPY